MRRALLELSRNTRRKPQKAAECKTDARAAAQGIWIGKIQIGMNWQDMDQQEMEWQDRNGRVRMAGHGLAEMNGRI